MPVKFSPNEMQAIIDQSAQTVHWNEPIPAVQAVHWNKPTPAVQLLTVDHLLSLPVEPKPLVPGLMLVAQHALAAESDFG